MPPGPVTMSLRNGDAFAAEAIDLGDEVDEDEVDAVPAAGTGLSAVGHGSAGGAGRAAEQQPQAARGVTSAKPAQVQLPVKPRCFV